MATLYRYFDSSDYLLYVGITGTGINRMFGHSMSSRWWAKVHHATFKHYKTREGALAAERKAIRLERPLYNVVHALHGPRYLPDVFARLDALPAVAAFVPSQELAKMLAIQHIVVLRAARAGWFDYMLIGRSYLIRIDGLRERIREFVNFGGAYKV